MAYSAEQIKGRIKNLAKARNANARTLLRLYMMERFLERLSKSPYRDNFIIKGGILVTAMVGVSMRSTMDIDTSIKNLDLSEEEIRKAVGEIITIDVGDNVSFELRDVTHIMDDMEYPGIRLSLDAVLGGLITPLKIDISTGDSITPREIDFRYPLLLEEKTIDLWAYNLETILAEKLQTILARGVLNTRMRDFYDIRTLLSVNGDRLDSSLFGTAFINTCRKRGTENLLSNKEKILISLSNDTGIQKLWDNYQKKYPYAKGITFTEVMDSIRRLASLLDGKNK